jgi:hypothetical protein
LRHILQSIIFGSFSKLSKTGCATVISRKNEIQPVTKCAKYLMKRRNNKGVNEGSQRQRKK